MYHHTKRYKLAHTALLNIPPRVLPPANNRVQPSLTDPQLTFQRQCIQPAIAPGSTDELRHFAFC